MRIARLLPCLLGSGLLVLAAPARAATCTWTRASPASQEEGPCELTEAPGGFSVSMGTRDWRVRLRDRRGEWSLVTLNGLEAMGHDVGMTISSYTTTDLNETLDVRLE